MWIKQGGGVILWINVYRIVVKIIVKINVTTQTWVVPEVRHLLGQVNDIVISHDPDANLHGMTSHVHWHNWYCASDRACMCVHVQCMCYMIHVLNNTAEYTSMAWYSRLILPISPK